MSAPRLGASSVGPSLLSRAVDLKAARTGGLESPLGARVDPAVAVLEAWKRPVTKKDGGLVAKQLAASRTIWEKVNGLTPIYLTAARWAMCRVQDKDTCSCAIKHGQAREVFGEERRPGERRNAPLPLVTTLINRFTDDPFVFELARVPARRHHRPMGCS